MYELYWSHQATQSKGINELNIYVALFSLKMCQVFYIVHIYIYAFSRCFYPKWLTVHLGCTFIVSMSFLGIEPTTFCTANAMLYHWATGTFRYVFYVVTFSPKISVNLTLLKFCFLVNSSINNHVYWVSKHSTLLHCCGFNRKLQHPWQLTERSKLLNNWTPNSRKIYCSSVVRVSYAHKTSIYSIQNTISITVFYEYILKWNVWLWSKLYFQHHYSSHMILSHKYFRLSMFITFVHIYVETITEVFIIQSI